MSRRYEYDVAASQTTLGQWIAQPARTWWSGSGEDAAQAYMGALVSAEAVALSASAVPPNVPIGTAAHHGDWAGAPAGARELYRATQYWVRKSGGTTLAAKGSVPDTGTQQALVALLVVGVAAIVAGAWYATSTSVVRIWAEHCTNIARLDRINKLAAVYIKSGKPVPQALWAQLGNVGGKLGAASDYVVPIGLGVGGLVLVGGGIALASRSAEVP